MQKIFRSIIPFLKKNRILILLLTVIIIGSFFRLHRFNDLARFNTDQVRDALIAEKIIAGEEFPLLGPKAGGTTFKLGPIFYYLQALSGFVFGNNPAGMVLFVGILAVASIPLLFLFLRYYFSANISLLLILCYSFSFYIIKYSRFGWNPNIIPFFFILFLLSLLKLTEPENRKFGKWHILLAISLGIGVQLHALLLALMPLLLLITYGYIFFKEKKIPWKHFAIISLIALSINLPFFIYDFQNEGKNIKSFLAGTQKKTSKNSSIVSNFLKDGQFFVQGNVYAISSFEPQKNWIKIKKLIKSRNSNELIAAFAGILFTFFGFFYMIKNVFTEKSEKKRKFLGLVLVATLLSFLILLPIANELNIRYFGILIFLPYIFLGFFFEFLLKNTWKKVAIFSIFISILFLATLNIKKYREIYDFENYTIETRMSSYGGISVKESRDISDFIVNLSKREDLATRNFLLTSFNFYTSVEYFNNKKGFKFSDKSEINNNSDLITIIVSDYKNTSETLEKNLISNNLIDSLSTGKFTVFAFEKKLQKEYKIGLITDIHAQRNKKNNYSFDTNTKRILEYFTNWMNNSFQPDFIIQNGDSIEGTSRKGQKSIDDFKLFLSYFKKFKMPVLHVNGNHEMRGFPKEKWLNLTGYEKSYYHIDHEELRIIVLDGNENDNVDEDYSGSYVMTEDQLVWLEKILSEKDDLIKIVFIHYPSLEAPGTKAINPDQSMKLREIFSKNGVEAVFSGHTEILSFDEIDGIRYFTLPGIEKSKRKKVLWLESFAEIRIKDDVEVKLFYKKDRDEEYKTLIIPSGESDQIEK